MPPRYRQDQEAQTAASHRIGCRYAVVSAAAIGNQHAGTSEIPTVRRWHLTGKHSDMQWYQRRRYIISMLTPVRCTMCKGNGLVHVKCVFLLDHPTIPIQRTINTFDGFFFSTFRDLTTVFRFPSSSSFLHRKPIALASISRLLYLAFVAFVLFRTPQNFKHVCFCGFSFYHLFLCFGIRGRESVVQLLALVPDRIERLERFRLMSRAW